MVATVKKGNGNSISNHNGKLKLFV